MLHVLQLLHVPGAAASRTVVRGVLGINTSTVICLFGDFIVHAGKKQQQGTSQPHAEGLFQSR